MPLLNINTNVKVAQTDQPQLLKAASQATAEMLGKPESYVMVKLQQDLPMTFGGSDEALALLELKSLGLPEDKTAEYSDKLCRLISEQLSVNSNRIYIEFSSPPRHMWGWDHKTF